MGKRFWLYIFLHPPASGLVRERFFFLGLSIVSVAVKIPRWRMILLPQLAHTIVKHKRVIKPFFDFSRKVMVGAPWAFLH